MEDASFGAKVMANKPEWIFGLAIDEELTWGAAQVERVDEKKEDGSPEFWYNYCLTDDILYGTLPGLEITKKLDLHKFIYESLSDLRHVDPIMKDVFDNAIAIGVSTIGLAQHNRLWLKSIARKEWINTGTDDYILDFRSLFAGLFGKTIQDSITQSRASTTEVDIAKISIHNDATARCLAEYQWQDQRDDPVESLFYVMISEGVNGGSIFDRKLLRTELHPEIGHIYPRIYEKDTGFKLEYSGCPVHQYCFEGVASGARIRKEWAARIWTGAGPKPAIPPPNDPVWDSIAYYIAQLCWDAVLFWAVQRIVVAGPYVFDSLIDAIRKYFHFFNAGSIDRKNAKPLDRPYLHYDAMLKPDDFIRPAKLRQHEAVLGALELARYKAAGLEVVLPLGRR